MSIEQFCPLTLLLCVVPNSGPEWQPLHTPRSFLAEKPMASSPVEATWTWVVFPVPVLFSLEGICIDGLVIFECFSFPELGLVQPYLKKKCEKTNSVTVFIQN